MFHIQEARFAPGRGDEDDWQNVCPSMQVDNRVANALAAPKRWIGGCVPSRGGATTVCVHTV
jgi:hypothetical protein